MFFFCPFTGIGMVLAALAMFYAGVIEISRKNDIAKHGYIEQTLSDVKFNASKISMFAQVPEFAFIGSSEVFASISGCYDTSVQVHLLTITWFIDLLLEKAM